MRDTVQGCVCEADDPSAPARHDLIAALATLGVVASEDYLGAGSYVIIVPLANGQEWSIANTFDAVPWRYWSAARVEGGELYCMHYNLGEVTTRPMLMARIVAERLLNTAHTDNDDDGDGEGGALE